MTLQTAFATVEAHGARPSAWRTTLVVFAYLSVIATGALIPIANPSPATPPAPYITPARQVALFVQFLVWLVPLLVAMERDPTGRFWKGLAPFPA